MRFTINGVSPRDAHAFLREVDAVVDRDYERVFDALTEQAELEADDPHDEHDEPFTGPMSWRWRVRFFDQSRAYLRVPAVDCWHDYRRGRDRFRSKRKEVK